MTKREKIIQYLIDHDINVLRFPFIIENREYQRPGTLVINWHYLRKDEQRKLDMIGYIETEPGKYRYDSECPIEVHDIRDHLKWIDGMNRIIWKGN